MAVEELEQKEQDQQQSESGKIGKKFEANLRKLVAVLRDDKSLKGKSRVPKDAVSTLIDELLKEKKETAAKKLKEDLNTLIDAKVGFDKAVAEEEKKLAKFKEEKMKEFNGKAEGILGQIEGLDQLTNDYYTAVTSTDVSKDGKPGDKKVGGASPAKDK